MIDGVHFADHLCVVAMGIGVEGTKHPLGLVEGDTENATVVKDLLADLRDRGLDTTRPVLCVLDGAKALVAAVKAVFDHPVVQRCQLHKVRNVESILELASRGFDSLHLHCFADNSGRRLVALARASPADGGGASRRGRFVGAAR